MIVLNYHRISETVGDAGLYTVSPVRFSQHLEVLVEHGVKVVVCDEVLDGRVDHKSVMLHFDDGTTDHFDKVAPLLGRYGFFGVFFISTAKIGNEGYLSEAEVRTMAEAGHSIECHGHSHRRMDRMPAEELAAELRKSVGEIQRLTGRRPRIIAPPGGFVSKQVVAAAAQMGMHVVRTMRWSDNPTPLRGTLDCLVVHHGVTPETIGHWLDGKGMRAMRTCFLAKQLVRSVMPQDLYLTLRHMLVREKKSVS